MARLLPRLPLWQAPEGFLKAGGFSGVYNGVLATALGAAPGAAMFFSAYEGMKPRFQAMNGGKEHPLQHSCAASCGEVAACLVRVPTAVVTQRMQVDLFPRPHGPRFRLRPPAFPPRPHRPLPTMATLFHDRKPSSFP